MPSLLPSPRPSLGSSIGFHYYVCPSTPFAAFLGIAQRHTKCTIYCDNWTRCQFRRLPWVSWFVRQGLNATSHADSPCVGPGPDAGSSDAAHGTFAIACPRLRRPGCCCVTSFPLPFGVKGILLCRNYFESSGSGLPSCSKCMSGIHADLTLVGPRDPTVCQRAYGTRISLVRLFWHCSNACCPRSC